MTYRQLADRGDGLACRLPARRAHELRYPAVQAEATSITVPDPLGRLLSGGTTGLPKLITRLVACPGSLGTLMNGGRMVLARTPTRCCR
ncbi:hypothetical protein ACIP4Y_38170 [Streptomyces sp. NPDC088810]|uniref:hypothetical protein n=1 Tax=unclassified Streptomyces TaxID=2593676 RepID=UPI0038082A8B